MFPTERLSTVVLAPVSALQLLSVFVDVVGHKHIENSRETELHVGGPDNHKKHAVGSGE